MSVVFDEHLDVSAMSPSAFEDVAGRFADGSWREAFEAISRAGFCAHPIRLVGGSTTVERATGAVVEEFSSESLPFGSAFVRCGNRRASVCPPCSRLHARDTFAMINAGVTGGKTVPESVAANPLLFVTLTAPSFGAVHGIRPGGGRCHPRSREGRCEHGKPLSCMRIHGGTDAELGAPLCAECYDSASAVVWQWWAPELWRRFTIALRRALVLTCGVPDSRLGERASLQYAKVAEYQSRGVVHFHALIRLDGAARDGIGSPAQLDAQDLAGAVRRAVERTEFLAPAVDDDDSPRVLRWGAQVDIRTVREGQRPDAQEGPITPSQVAGYLAKYATKDAGDLASGSRGAEHLARMRAVCVLLHERALEADGIASPYWLLGKWAHMLGFRGHFSTKSRRFSVTLGALRRARRRWQRLVESSRRTGIPVDVADLEARLLSEVDEDETTLVVGHWRFQGVGWPTDGDRELALAAAARAREYAQWRAARRHGQRQHDN